MLKKLISKKKRQLKKQAKKALYDAVGVKPSEIKKAKKLKKVIKKIF